ncbi:MAG: NUDIX domain-containing protein [Gammaproteobacteria bacterium]|nr:NUDIX domain-containing protein [Gammaproteobacteria bacterium]
MMSKGLTSNPASQNQDGTIDNSAADCPLLAATMVLVRDQPKGYEVFMIERPAKGAFAKLHVFPGGKIDPSDSELAHYCQMLTDIRASQILSVKDHGLRYWVCAIRECFEECGVLFAHQNDEILKVRTETERLRVREWAERVSTSSEDFQLVLETHKLTLATDEVHYFSHWITPEIAPVRFDTRFFLAKLPQEQRADAQSTEIVSACWVRPNVALENFRTKAWRMILPTLTTLRMISNYTDTEDLIKQVRTGYHKIPVRPGKQLQGMQPFLDQW